MPTARASTVQVVATAAVLTVPFGLALAAAVGWAGGRGPTVLDLSLTFVLYAVACFGITAGYHRLFTHRGFVPNRPLKIALAAAGSAALEGSVESWVANHRLHHVRSDQPGDPHSPYAPFDPDGEATTGRTWRGALHSHVGWLFTAPPADVVRHAADIAADPDLRFISKWFPVFAGAGFVVPFLAGWAVTGRAGDGLWAMAWAGGVRTVVLLNVTWAINSVTHMWGKQPFPTRDRSRNVAWLALVSAGESWHNAHHAHPRVARHGMLPRQVDLTANLIAGFERAGWATEVRWPTAKHLATARVDSAEPVVAPRPALPVR